MQQGIGLEQLFGAAAGNAENGGKLIAEGDLGRIEPFRQDRQGGICLDGCSAFLLHDGNLPSHFVLEMATAKDR
ncbi:hypothetical protein [Pseudomonas capsici]|uniref:hypothetical protein n=1 Tax=Pseudomonas capsici TaxID=2810614 RepID=UPI0021F1CCEC|nr:hypothetical protein [Pseudomonas capsici]MCV4340589.1 hypothetical protein [Pseudomonas capsici]